MKKLTIDTLIAELDIIVDSARTLMESDHYGAALHCDSMACGACDMFQSVCWALGDYELADEVDKVRKLKRDEMNAILGR